MARLSNRLAPHVATVRPPPNRRVLPSQRPTFLRCASARRAQRDDYTCHEEQALRRPDPWLSFISLVGTYHYAMPLIPDEARGPYPFRGGRRCCCRFSPGGPKNSHLD